MTPSTKITRMYHAANVFQNSTHNEILSAMNKYLTRVFINQSDPGFNAAFEAYKKAFDTLTDVVKKQHYDEHGDSHTEYSTNTVTKQFRLYALLDLETTCTKQDIEAAYIRITSKEYPTSQNVMFIQNHHAARILHFEPTHKSYNVKGDVFVPFITTSIPLLCEMRDGPASNTDKDLYDLSAHLFRA